MKVLLINSVCGSGSTGKICVDIYNLLKENDIECKIIYGRGTISQNKDFLKYGNDLDFYINTFESRILDNHGLGTKFYTKKIVEYIDEFNPDIIHLHNIHGYYLNYEILFNYLKKANKHVIWTLHDCWAFTGHCSYFNDIKCEKWKDKCENCPQKKEYPSSFLVDRSYKNYIVKQKIFTSLKKMVFVTPSSWLSELLADSFLSKYHREVIKNGIDLEKFKLNGIKYEFDEIHNGKKILLGVAQIWNQRKGLEYFLQLSKVIEDDYLIVLIGLSKKQLSEMKLPNNILGFERTGSVDVLTSFYRSAEYFLNLSLDDNYPTVCLEAQACGTDVLTFDVGGCKETLFSEKSKSFEVGDINGMYAYIKNNQNPEFKCDLTKLDKKITFFKYMNLYKDVIKSEVD